MKSKNKLAINISYHLAYQLIVILSPLVVTPYLSRVLGPTEIGKYSYAYSIAYYFVLFGTLGITQHGSRQIAKVKDDKENLNKTFSNLFWIHELTAIASTLLYLAFALSVQENKIIAMIMTLYVASSIFDVKWLFYGLENFKLTVIRNFIIKALSIILIFLFVKKRTDIVVYSLIMAGVSFFLSEISLFVLFPKYVKLGNPSTDIKYEIIPLIIMFIPTAANLICRHIDKVMLGMMSTLDQVGYYENTDKLYLMLVTFVTTVGDVILPRMTNLISNNKKDTANKLFISSLEICLIVSCAFMFGISAIADDFVPLFFGDEFLECIILIKAIAPTILFLTLSSTIRKQYLIPRYMNKVFMTSVITGTIINVIANYLLIPKYNALGAVYGTIIAESLILAIQIVMTYKEIDYKYISKKALASIVFGLIMYMAIRRLSLIPLNNVIIKLVIEIMVGGIIYLFLVLIYLVLSKDPILDSFRKRK